MAIRCEVKMDDVRNAFREIKFKFILFSLDNNRNIKGWCRDLRRFTKKIKAANRKYLEEVLKLKENLQDSVMQEEVYEFFLDVTQSLILYVKKLTKSIRPFIISLKEGRSFSMLAGRTQRMDLLKSMKIFKTSIMEVMKTFFKIIDRTKELELCSLAAGCKQANSVTGISSGTRFTSSVTSNSTSHQILGQMQHMYYEENNNL